MQGSHSFTVTAAGGILNVLQTPCHVAEAFDPANPPQPLPTFHPFVGIWDTGATNSVITQEVVDALKLRPIGMTLVSGVGGSEMSETFLVNVGLLNGVQVHTLRVTKGKLPPGAHVLIGMDIIANGDFAVTNRNGNTVFTFCLPSHRCLDFVAEHNAKQAQNRPGFRGYTPPKQPGGGKRKRRR